MAVLGTLGSGCSNEAGGVSSLSSGFLVIRKRDCDQSPQTGAAG